ncbi:MarR family transcriptional regulator [Corallococcus macrosporus]|uniref:MarR family transcriptional regulator n=1 Tax=Corallococcus macrosporus TaxID=35 RepID=A0ABS3DPC1_9BACT|nr:MarR family transcriptional regulator [Corallococcus macrosporus]MBN8233175.1 MarR family transcriptional regulator [Corallococcus macrosporus]
MKRGLGTQLRHLLELLDGAVARAYAQDGLTFRPRFTPVVRALLQAEPLTLGRIAELAGITQPAATQTVALMAKEGLVTVAPGEVDGRQRLVRLSDEGRALLPRLQQHWQATATAAEQLDAELAAPLSRALEGAIEALEARPFDVRIAEARAARPGRHGRRTGRAGPR